MLRFQASQATSTLEIADSGDADHARDQNAIAETLPSEPAPSHDNLPEPDLAAGVTEQPATEVVSPPATTDAPSLPAADAPASSAGAPAPAASEAEGEAAEGKNEAAKEPAAVAEGSQQVTRAAADVRSEADDAGAESESAAVRECLHSLHSLVLSATIHASRILVQIVWARRRTHIACYC